MTYKVGFVYLFLQLLSFILFSQNQKEQKVFKQQIENLSIDDSLPADFRKACYYFSERNWDSTLVLTDKIINSDIPESLRDYCYYFRGASFFNKGIYKEALKSFYQVSDKFEFDLLASVVKGEIFLEQRIFDSAVFYFRKAETSVHLPQARDIEMSMVHHNLGISYMHLGQYVSAEKYLKKSIEAQESNGDTTLLVGSYGDLANVYYEQYKDDLAIPLFLKAYQLSKFTRNVLLKQNTALNMSVVEENRKDFPAALKYRKEYEMWRDSLKDQNRIYEVAQLEKQIAVGKKEKEVSLLQAENDLRRAERNGVIYLAVALLSLLIIAIYFYREKVKSSQTILLQKEALTELNETKDKLFSVVSHDLRTAVSSLKTNQTKLQKHYVSGEFQKVESIIASGNAMANGTYNLLDNLFQWALLQTNQAYFSVEPLKLFYIVEQVAYNYEGLFDEKEIIFSLQIPKQTIVFADQETLKITLRNLIDNAIKYTNRGGSVNIYVARQTHENCNLIIEDNGIGISEEAIALLTNEDRLSEARRKGYVKGSGIGLQLCQKMIERNHGQFKIESKKGEGTRIILTLMKIYQQANGKN